MSRRTVHVHRFAIVAVSRSPRFDHIKSFLPERSQNYLSREYVGMGRMANAPRRRCCSRNIARSPPPCSRAVQRANLVFRCRHLIQFGVIPGRREAAGPESITVALNDGFRARGLKPASGNDGTNCQGQDTTRTRSTTAACGPRSWLRRSAPTQRRTEGAACGRRRRPTCDPA